MIRKINPRLVDLSSREGLKIIFILYDEIKIYLTNKISIEMFLNIWEYYCLKEIPIYYDDYKIKLKNYDKAWVRFDNSLYNLIIKLDISNENKNILFRNNKERIIYDKINQSIPFYFKNLILI